MEIVLPYTCSRKESFSFSYVVSFSSRKESVSFSYVVLK